MASKFQQLLTPLQLGKITLSNRVAMAPLTRGRSEDFHAGELQKVYYEQRASAGLIISEGVHISKQGVGWPYVPGIYSDDQIPGWKKVTDAVHAKGGHIFVQLWHQGRQSHSSFHNGELPVAPSAIAVNGQCTTLDLQKVPYETPRALLLEEIPAIIQDYVNAAKRAVAAGFDGVEIHDANGYLLDTFLQSKTNHRTDKYGGSVENRARLSLEVVRAVTNAIGKDRVGIRFSPNGVFGDVGSPDYKEQFDYVLRGVGKIGVVYVHVMDGLGFGSHGLGPQYTLKDARAALDNPGIVLMGNCGYSAEEAEKLLVSGDADLMAFGRVYLSNPDFVERLRSGAELAPTMDMKGWYGHHYKPSEFATCYTDQPTAK